jgi:hypothetical protein
VEVIVAEEVVRRRSRQAVPPPKTVQFSLTQEGFDQPSNVAARAGMARGAFAAEVTLAAASGAQARTASPLRETLDELMEATGLVRRIGANLNQAVSKDRRTPSGLLLARQAYYLIGFDASPETSAWLAQMYRTDRRVVRPARGWSPFWPLARSTASALTRLGDPEPMRRFIADQLCDEAGERANLNYWAFWTGDFDEQQT